MGKFILWYIAIVIVGMVILIPVELIGVALSTILIGFLAITIWNCICLYVPGKINCITL